MNILEADVTLLNPYEGSEVVEVESSISAKATQENAESGDGKAAAKV